MGKNEFYSLNLYSISLDNAIYTIPIMYNSILEFKFAIMVETAGTTAPTSDNQSLDKCGLDGQTCHHHAKCIMINNLPSKTSIFTCECRLGFIGNGTWCQDIDECKTKPSICPYEYQECVNTLGSYRCQCDELRRNGSYYSHNCSKCALECENGKICMVHNITTAFCMCLPGSDCLGPSRKKFAATAGVIIGCVAAGIAVASVLFFCYLRWKSRRREAEEQKWQEGNEIKNNGEENKEKSMNNISEA
ncbi:uncharacterized protein TRIADDRAFT_62420 [Trichoplax adhaerens]|uniref:EGF-like domain-containing protein n=1 Tax=Trichoplax adhaerens TaxID=10228 RepID=B3SDR0_TRIAD|nr:hypothetical protein TRIADDRAFT_62420 [Trichoplax adhaerens]EDV19141.1 hypothetical protein TRIADDRAFT_62420 [Trichoplax adhaerens]|eukprot:XP_002118374.1 hypothetical protein TRIADDRAFT_62420 [Trichoplax adhaerens]